LLRGDHVSHLVLLHDSLQHGIKALGREIGRESFKQGMPAGNPTVGKV
jgi:hypothetical protein